MTHAEFHIAGQCVMICGRLISGPHHMLEMIAQGATATVDESQYNRWAKGFALPRHIRWVRRATWQPGEGVGERFDLEFSSRSLASAAYQRLLAMYPAATGTRERMARLAGGRI